MLLLLQQSAPSCKPKTLSSCGFHMHCCCIQQSIASHDLVGHWVQEGTKRSRDLKLQCNTAAAAAAAVAAAAQLAVFSI
jgi:hypothetical protein